VSDDPLRGLLSLYRRDLPLDRAFTIPAAWYTDNRILDLERRTVFPRSWQMAARAEQVGRPGQFATCELSSGDPVLVVRGDDGVLRAFFNVCRHHAAAVVDRPEGVAQRLRCPYHGWTYALDGTLKGTPDFAGVCDFDATSNGLMPVALDVWEKWVFVRVEERGPSLAEFLTPDLVAPVAGLGLGSLHWFERRSYFVDCNWKVFVDNYLDGGYHVPHLHKALDAQLDYANYTIDNGARFCVQASPTADGGGASYYWVYPNFMMNAYADRMDTNLVIPRGVDRTEVVFDFYFADVSAAASEANRASIAASERIQDEDVGICASVQRGLGSRAYTAGRLSVRRERGEHLFHQLLASDLTDPIRGS
jgi:choline monooxygenase